MNSRKVYVVSHSGVPAGAYVSLRGACYDLGWSYWNVARRLVAAGFYVRVGTRIDRVVLSGMKPRGRKR